MSTLVRITDGEGVASVIPDGDKFRVCVDTGSPSLTDGTTSVPTTAWARRSRARAT